MQKDKNLGNDQFIINSEDLSYNIIGAAMKVHDTLGPGLLESAYESCLAYELTKREIKFKRQVPLPIHYDGVLVDCGYRLDFLIEDSIVLELKAIEKLLPIHEAQIMTYVKLSKCTLGIIINFNVLWLKDGIRRIVI